MRIKVEEVLDLLSKWLAEEALLECSVSFPGFVARFRGRVFGIEPDGFRLLSDDSNSELAFRLEPWMEFSFGDVGPNVADEFEGLLVFAFPPFGERAAVNRVALAEVKE